MSEVDYGALANEKAQIGRTSEGRGRKLGGAALAFVGIGAMAYLLWMQYGANRGDVMARTGTEQFTVPASPMPEFQEAAKKDGGRSDAYRKVEAPPPPPPAEKSASTVDPTAELMAKLKLAEEQRRLEAERAERARREAEEKALREKLAREEALRQERIRSALIVMDKDDADRAGGAAGAAGGAAGGPAVVKQETETDANRAFLMAASNRDVEVSMAHRLPRTDALVAQGTLIRGTLDVAIQSDLPGMVRATTTGDVWSLDGRRVLIPSGSRLIGEYRSGLQRGQTRIFVVWTRMIDAENKTSVQLGSIGTDDLGRAGLTGEIDRHYVERFGSAILLSIVGGASQYIAGLGQSQNTVSTSVQTYDPATGRYITSQSQPNQDAAQARRIGAQQVSQTLNQIASDALKESINIAPTINVDQGTRIEIFVRRDLDFSGLYPDPVKAEAARIGRGGAIRRDVDPTPLARDPSVLLAPSAAPSLPVRKP